MRNQVRLPGSCACKTFSPLEPLGQQQYSHRLNSPMTNWQESKGGHIDRIESSGNPRTYAACSISRLNNYVAACIICSSILSWFHQCITHVWRRLCYDAGFWIWSPMNLYSVTTLNRQHHHPISRITFALTVARTRPFVQFHDLVWASKVF
jgi:hypothetical protein